MIFFFLLINMKMPTIVGIFKIISRENFMLSSAEHEIFSANKFKNKFDNLGPDDESSLGAYAACYLVGKDMPRRISVVLITLWYLHTRIIHYITGLTCLPLPRTSFHTSPHDSGGVLWYHVMSVRPSARSSIVRPSVFSFPDDNLSKCQWIFTKLGVCIDIVEIWFGIVNGQILSIFDRVICPQQIQIFISGRKLY